jgi:hypothetical protein
VSFTVTASFSPATDGGALDLKVITGAKTLSTLTPSITAVTFTTTTITATIASTTGMYVGMPITIAGITGFSTNNPNGSYTISAVTSTTQFQYVASLAPTGTYSSGGIVTYVSFAAAVIATHNATNVGTPITPAFSHSLLVWGLVNDDNTGTYSALASNTLYNSGTDSGNKVQWADGYYSGTVTAGTAATVGATSSVSSGWENVYAAAEIPSASTSTPVASVPSGFSYLDYTASSTDASLTSASISPPGGSLLLAIATVDASSDPTVTMTDTAGLVWSPLVTEAYAPYEATVSIFAAQLYPTSTFMPFFANL